MFSITSGWLFSFISCIFCFLVSFVNGVKSSPSWLYLTFPPFASSSINLPPKFIFICSPTLLSAKASCLACSLAFLFSSSISCLIFNCSSLFFCFCSNLSSLFSCDFSIKLFIISDAFIPNTNTAKIITIPTHKIIAPIGPNSFTSGTASIAPNAPPPFSCVPNAYESFTTSDKLLSIVKFPTFTWYTHISTAKLINKIAHWANFELKYSSSSIAIFIAIANIPIGNTYFIIPIIPPKISFSFTPITPDLAYINTPNKILTTINATTAKSIFDTVFLVVFLLFLFVFLFAIFTNIPFLQGTKFD